MVSADPFYSTEKFYIAKAPFSKCPRSRLFAFKETFLPQQYPDEMDENCDNGA